MTNLLEQAISCDDGDQAAKIIQHALGIESDVVLKYTFPKDWPTDREVRARIIGGWLQAEALRQRAQFESRVTREISSHGFLPPIHCKSVPGIISSYPCL